MAGTTAESTERSLSTRAVWTIFVGLMLATLLAALDQTIVATALPTIVRDLGGAAPTMHWYPFVTFWQVTADMMYSTGVPPGHGHSYGTESMRAWLDIAPPDGWTAGKTTVLDTIIANTKSD